MATTIRSTPTALESKPRYRNLSEKLLRVTSPQRLDAFLDFGTKSDRDFWECLCMAWMTCESVTINKPVWLSLMSGQRPGKEKWLMTKEEVSFLATLPDTVTVYRGCPVNKTNGLSWTLSRETAIWFANRFNFKKKEKPFDQDCCLIEGTVMKKHILAYLDGRNESEIVCDSRYVRGKKQEVVAPPRRR